MLKISSCCALALFLVIIGGVSRADTYRCTRPDGSVFYTDDPSQVPKGCVIELIKEAPPAGVVSDAPALQPAAPAAEQPIPQQRQSDSGRSFDSFAKEAGLLVELFQDARQKAVRSTLAADKMKARRELADIRAQVNALQHDIRQSSLSTPEKQTLENQLAPLVE